MYQHIPDIKQTGQTALCRAYVIQYESGALIAFVLPLRPRPHPREPSEEIVIE